MNSNSLLKSFLKYVGLNILGQMIYSCYTMADTFFVSAKLGADGLTALNLAFPVFCLINGIGLMTGMGAGTGFSIHKSRGNLERANKIFTNAAYIASTFALLFFCLGLFFSETLVRALGADDHIFSMTHTYLKVMLLFAPAFLANNLIQCFIRNDGNPSLSSRAMITGSVCNIILDYVFIFPMNMGIFGAIFATGLAPVISIAVTLPYFIKKRNGFHFMPSLPSYRSSTEIISGGIPPFLSEAASGIVMFLFNYILLKLNGNIGVAAFSIITVISLAVIAVYTGLSQGIQPLISQNYGADKPDNVRLLFRYSIYTMLAISAVIYSGIFCFAHGLASAFNSEGIAELQQLAVNGMRMYFTACPFIGLNLVISTYFVSTDCKLPAQIISLLRSCIILIPSAFLLSYMFGINGVWCAYPVSEFITACIVLLKYKQECHSLCSSSI